MAAVQTQRTALLAATLVAAGCLHAILQEKLFEASLGRSMPLLITSFEFGCCSALSLGSLLLQRAQPFAAPHRTLLRISVLVLASLVSGNVALRWVSYPIKASSEALEVNESDPRSSDRKLRPPRTVTQVVVKSCKLLPTMALGAVLLRKRYSRADQLAAILLCAGLVGFTLSGSSAPAVGGEPSSPCGVVVLLFAVSCDAVQVLLSERMLRDAPHLTPNHVMLHTNGFAFLAVLCGVAGSGELARARSVEIPWLTLVLYGACSWIGVSCFVGLTRAHGATAAVVATNGRKLLTVVLSFALFPKPLGTGFVLSGFAVVAGVYIRSRSRNGYGANGATNNLGLSVHGGAQMATPSLRHGEVATHRRKAD